MVCVDGVHIITMALGKSSGSGVAWRKRRGNFGPFRACDVVGENVGNRRCAIRWKLITHGHQKHKQNAYTESLVIVYADSVRSRRSHQTHKRMRRGRWTHVLPPTSNTTSAMKDLSFSFSFFSGCRLSASESTPLQLRQIIINNRIGWASSRGSKFHSQRKKRTRTKKKKWSGNRGKRGDHIH